MSASRQVQDDVPTLSRTAGEVPHTHLAFHQSASVLLVNSRQSLLVGLNRGSPTGFPKYHASPLGLLANSIFTPNLSTPVACTWTVKLVCVGASSTQLVPS